MVWGAPGGQPLTLTTNTSAPIRHRLPDFFPGFSGGHRSPPAANEADYLAESRDCRTLHHPPRPGRVDCSRAQRQRRHRGPRRNGGLRRAAGGRDVVREPFAQFIYRSAAERQGRQDPRTSAGDLDLTIYSLRKRTRLALKGDPQSSCCCSHRTINSSVRRAWNGAARAGASHRVASGPAAIPRRSQADASKVLGVTQPKVSALFDHRSRHARIDS